MDSLWNAYVTWQEDKVKCTVQISTYNTQLTSWLSDWVFVCKLSDCEFESSCSHLNFRFRACLEQGVPWHSGNYRVWICSETCTWYDKMIKSNAPYRQVLRTLICPVWLSGWAFVYVLIGCRFEFSRSHLKLWILDDVLNFIKINQILYVIVYTKVLTLNIFLKLVKAKHLNLRK